MENTLNGSKNEIIRSEVTNGLMFFAYQSLICKSTYVEFFH